MGYEFETEQSSNVEAYRLKLDRARRFSELWEIVKQTVRDTIGKYRGGMMLFLDDLPLQMGAYHPLGSNNIVLNRTLITIVENTIKEDSLLNAFVYHVLAHEYLHALGYLSEEEVRSLVYKVSRHCFGDDHPVVRLSEDGPWSILKGIQLGEVEGARHGLEVVKDFEEPNQRYIT